MTGKESVGRTISPETLKFREEALALARQVIKELEGDPSDRALWLVLQAQLRSLQIHQQSGKLNEFLAEATELLEKYSGSVDELIVTSLVYHAYKRQGARAKALETRDKLKIIFDNLPAAADSADSGIYSRVYW